MSDLQAPAPLRHWRIHHAATGQWFARAAGRGGRWTARAQSTAFADREAALDALAALRPDVFAQARLVEEETRAVSDVAAADLLPTPPAVRTTTVSAEALRASGDWRAETQLARARR